MQHGLDDERPFDEIIERTIEDILSRIDQLIDRHEPYLPAANRDPIKQVVGNRVLLAAKCRLQESLA